jgi:tetratricopeptide (TPR) repeat protein
LALGPFGAGLRASLLASPESMGPAFESVGPEWSNVEAPVLALEGLKPWDRIPSPGLYLEEPVEEEEPPVAVSTDPAQLELEPAPQASVVAEQEVTLDRPAVAADSELEILSPQARREDPPLLDADVHQATGESLPDDSDGPVAVATASAPSEAEPWEVPVAPVEAPEAPPTPEPDPAELLYVQAREAEEGGRTEEARRLYRQLLATHPSHVRARNNLALLLDAIGEHAGALTELDRALDVDPENTTLLVNRGALLGAMGRYAAAERDLKRVLRVEPAQAEALFNLGVVMTKKGLWAEAVPHLRRAVELDPARAPAFYYLGEALNHVDDLQGAMTAYQRAAELQPTNSRALYGLGIVYDRLGRPDDAARMYRRSREVGRR